MAENNNYIGVAMGLDVTDLKAGLSEANKQIQLANSEFKSASSGMDNWSQSIEGVSAKVKQLDTILNAQKSKLAGLTAEYEKVAKEQGEGSEAARRLKVQINNQQAVVNKTQKEFDNYSETLKQAENGTIDLEKATIGANGKIKDLGDGAKDASDKMGGIGKIAKGVVGGVAAIGTAVAGAVTSFLALASSTQEYREDMSRLDAAFEASGKSAESAKSTYTDLYRAIGETDTAVEASQQIALLAESEEQAAKWAGLATGVVGTFGDALKPETFFEAANETIKLGEATGAFTQMLEGTGYSVDKFNTELAACTTEQEKQALMLRISEEQLGAAGKAYEEQAGSILDAREASANLTDALAELGAIAEPILTTLKQLAADLLKEIQPFVELIGDGLTKAFSGGAGGAEMLAEGIGGILNMLVERITNMLPTILNIILQLIPSIATTLLNALPQLLTVVTDLIIQIINLLATLLPQIVTKIVEIIPLLINNLMAALPQLLQAAITLLMAIVDALPTIIASLINELPKVIDTILTAVLDAFPLLLDGAIQLFMALIDALPIIIQALITNLPRIIDTIVKAVVNAVPLLLDGAIQLFHALIDAIPVIIPLLISEIPKITRGIVSSLLDAIPDLIKAGADLLGGLIKGLLDFKTIKKAIKSLGDSIVKGFKDFFGIASPSKLIENEIGTFVGQAVVPTRQSALSKVKKQLANFSGFVTDNLGNIKTGLDISANEITGGGASGSGARGRANGGNTVVNAGLTLNYNGKLSRKEVKKQESDHYTNIKLKLAREGVI